MRELIVFMNDDIPMWSGEEIVRCKDCIYRNELCGMGEHRWCEKMKMSTVPGDYCSYGERRKDGEECTNTTR